jgi:L-2-hydroxyglutarate oxidase
LVDDFLFVGQGTAAGAVLHVLNAPSPAATAALPIGREILETLTGEKLGPL